MKDPFMIPTTHSEHQPIATLPEKTPLSPSDADDPAGDGIRVLVVVHGYPPTHIGGAEQRAARTATALARSGYEVRVLCTEEIHTSIAGVQFTETIEDHVQVRRLYYNLTGAHVPFRWSYDNPMARQALEEQISQWRPDVLYLFSGYLMSASIVDVAYTHGIPIMLELTDYWWICHRINLLQPDGHRCDGPTPTGCARCLAAASPSYRMAANAWPYGETLLWNVANEIPGLRQVTGIAEQLARSDYVQRMLTQVDILITPSQYLADRYVAFGVNPAKIRVHRQGVNLDHCLLPISSERLRVVYLGQIKAHKGVDLLTQAWSQLQSDRPRQLTLYGNYDATDPYMQQIQAEIDALPDASWPGAISHEHLWEILAATDILVLPSRWVENSPNVILEAQAVGIPVICTRLGGMSELITHERNGLLFTVDDSADLARQLQRLLDDEALRHRLRQQPLPFKTVEDRLRDTQAILNALATRSA